MPKKLLATTVVYSGIICCSSIFAQSTPTDVFEKAPPHIDEALRSRVSQFLQAHVDGKYRVANELVAEDSKDMYFAMEKRRFLSFEILRINYTDNFTKATVVAMVEVNWRPSPRFPNTRMKPPYKMLWKLEGGEWYWYTVNTGEWDTPFGTMKVPGATTEQSDPAAAVIAQIRGMNAQSILNQIKVSKTDIALRCYEDSADSIEITNEMPGPVSLRMEGSPVVGLDIKFDRHELKSGETAKVTFQYAPPTKQPKPPAVAAMRVDPIGHLIRFNLTFAIPPEVEKQLQQSK
jgi:hypothetical protein